MRDIALFILAVWMIAQGVLALTAFHFPYEKQLLPLLALTAGIVLLMYVIKTKIANLGLLLLSLWLILRSSLYLFHYSFPYSDMVVAILGVVSGVVLMIRK